MAADPSSTQSRKEFISEAWSALDDFRREVIDLLELLRGAEQSDRDDAHAYFDRYVVLLLDLGFRRVEPALAVAAWSDVPRVEGEIVREWIERIGGRVDAPQDKTAVLEVYVSETDIDISRWERRR